jgi:hypothetical protein
LGQISCASASAGQTATNTRPYIDFASSTRARHVRFVYHGRPQQRDANRHMAPTVIVHHVQHGVVAREELARVLLNRVSASRHVDGSSRQLRLVLLLPSE